MRERLTTAPEREHFGGHAIVLMVGVRMADEAHVPCPGAVAVAISHRGLHVEQPGAAEIGPVVTLVPSHAREKDSRVHGDLPVVPARSGLNGEHMRVVRQLDPGGALHGRRPIGPGVVQLGDGLEDHAVGERAVDPVVTGVVGLPGYGIDVELAGLRIDRLVRSHGLVLILTRHDQHGVVRQLEDPRIPPGIPHIGAVPGLRRRGPLVPDEGEAVLHGHGLPVPTGDGVASRDEVQGLLVGRGRVVEVGLIERRKQGREVPIARRSGRPARPMATLGSRGPPFGLRIEDVDPVETIAAVHVVAADAEQLPVGQRSTAVAIQVGVHAFRVARILERPPVQERVRVGQPRDVVLPAVLERIGMAEVPQLHVLDPAIVPNPSGYGSRVAVLEAAVQRPVV